MRQDKLISRLVFFVLRYGLLLLSCSLLALFPWAMSAISNPLPLDLQKTGTILAITRTARIDPTLAGKLVLAMGFTSTPTSTATATITTTPTITQTPTSTATLTSTVTRTPTSTLTPFPDVRGIANSVVNTYSCPGSNFKKGSLQFGAAFHVQGWDQTIEDGETITWLLIEDLMDNPQRWVQESSYVTLTNPDYLQFIPRAACRSAS